MNLNKLKNFLWIQKEGILAGIGVALLVYYANFKLPVSISIEGIPKLIILILIFGIGGMVVDMLYKPNQ